MYESAPSARQPSREGLELAVCVDTMVMGVHCPPDTALPALGDKVLAVNLSDLAAMGAEPDTALLSLTLPEPDPSGEAEFLRGARECARRHGVRIACLTRASGPTSATAQLHGWVPAGTALRRDGARPGDHIYVTGTLGDAGLALALWNAHSDPQRTWLEAVRPRLERPAPRLHAGQALRGVASAAIDVSDGLAADLGHILERSAVGATVHADRLPISATLRAALGPAEARRLALGAGDDYELCFTVAPAREAKLAASLPYLRCAARRIGTIEARPGLRVLDADGAALARTGGWMHFA